MEENEEFNTGLTTTLNPEELAAIDEAEPYEQGLGLSTEQASQEMLFWFALDEP